MRKKRWSQPNKTKLSQIVLPLFGEVLIALSRENVDIGKGKRFSSTSKLLAAFAISILSRRPRVSTWACCLQTKAVDDLLRLMERLPAVVEALREIRALAAGQSPASAPRLGRKAS